MTKQIIAAGVVLSMMTACSLFSTPQGTGNVVTSVAGVIECIGQKEAAGETPAQIAVDCGGLAVEDVIAILAAQHQAAARAACARPDAGPGKVVYETEFKHKDGGK